MKKNLQTLLTAAAFASVIGGANVQNVNAADMSGMKLNGNNSTEDYAPEKDEVQGVYGPPEWFDNQNENIVTTPDFAYDDYENLFGVATTTEDITEVFVTATTTAQPQLAYGPIWVMLVKGDVTGDYKIDALDMAKMRSMLVTGEGASYGLGKVADVNGDGEFNIADLVSLRNYMLGVTKKYEIPEEQVVQLSTTTTSPYEDIEPIITATDETWHATVYGPPEYFGITSELEKLITTTTTSTPITTYGPPAMRHFYDQGEESSVGIFNSTLRTTQTTAAVQETELD